MSDKHSIGSMIRALWRAAVCKVFGHVEPIARFDIGPDRWQCSRCLEIIEGGRW